MKTLIPLLLISASLNVYSDDRSDQIPVNSQHFGCWEHVTNRAGGAENTFALCISSDEISLNVFFPNQQAGPGFSATCGAKGGLAGFGEDGSRMYFFGAGGCSNHRKLEAMVFICSREEENLKCEDMNLSAFSQDKKIEYKNTFMFSPR